MITVWLNVLWWETTRHLYAHFGRIWIVIDYM